LSPTFREVEEKEEFRQIPTSAACWNKDTEDVTKLYV
jgi:hypothetical protein